jgi:hypothetical protein
VEKGVFDRRQNSAGRAESSDVVVGIQVRATLRTIGAIGKGCAWHSDLFPFIVVIVFFRIYSLR